MNKLYYSMFTLCHISRFSTLISRLFPLYALLSSPLSCSFFLRFLHRLFLLVLSSFQPHTLSSNYLRKSVGLTFSLITGERLSKRWRLGISSRNGSLIGGNFPLRKDEIFPNPKNILDVLR